MQPNPTITPSWTGYWGDYGEWGDSDHGADGGLDDDDDDDCGDNDQLHQAGHIPDHLPLQHLKHHHIDDRARGDALQNANQMQILTGIVFSN